MENDKIKININININIDKDKCIGCGLCATIAPNTFEIDEDSGKSRVIDVSGDSIDKQEEARDNCPVDAIEIIKN